MTQTIFLPVLERIEISGFDMYRAKGSSGEFAWDFLPGPNALLGVNGLGKSTLINMIFRLITGPYDLNRRALDGDLGQPDTTPVLIGDRRMFAKRVGDQAGSATAKLNFRLGPKRIEVERRLSDLRLTSFVVDGLGRPTPEDDKDQYHDDLSDLMQVGSFFDALLLLRFLVFVFEDRRSLVWDESAQRQIFRATMSPASAASRSLQLQRTIVESDSAARNIRVQVNKATRNLNDAIAGLSKRDSSMAELQVGEQTVQAIRERHEDLLRQLEDLDAEMLRERRNRMRAEYERDDLLRQLDGAKLTLLKHLFGSLEPAARLSLIRTLESGVCSCCGQDAPNLQNQIRSALDSGVCPLCGQPMETGQDVPTATPEQVQALEAAYETAVAQSTAGGVRMKELEVEGTEIRASLSAGDRELNAALIRQNALKRNVSIEPNEVTQRRYTVDALTSAMNEALKERRTAEEDLRALADELEGDVRNKQEAIATSFARFAGAFMRENCMLTYIGRDARIGQEGVRFRFPAFQVALSGAAVAGATLRDSPGAVSLSQREFIDIAFRMAVMDVVTPSYGTTLVVDTPEAGLDFLFAERAGSQFLAFSKNSNDVSNRIIVTSNLVSEHLLVALLADTSDVAERRGRLLNLMEHAAPTAAVRLDFKRYSEFYDEIVNASGP